MSYELKQSQSVVSRVYGQIIFLGLMMHMLYIALFGWLSLPWMVIYNIGSTLFYALMLVLISYSRYREAVSLIYLEVGLFVTVGTLTLGWEIGLPLLLVALATMVYICPYRHSWVPYLFSAAEIALFLGLKLYCDVNPALTVLKVWMRNGLFLFNALMSFGIILFSSYLFNVSASLAQRKLQKENAELNEAASIDPLTGLLSRYGLEQQLVQFRNQPMSAAMGDLDDFKQINDTYGHICGDYVLSACARLMKAQENTVICRWGGEEFLILFPQTALPEALSKLEAIMAAVRNYTYLYDGHQIRVTMTFGLVEGRADLSLTDQIEAADQRMYLGKQRGKNQIISDEIDFS